MHAHAFLQIFWPPFFCFSATCAYFGITFKFLMYVLLQFSHIFANIHFSDSALTVTVTVPVERDLRLCPDWDKFYGCPFLKALLIQDISYTPIER